MSTLQGLDPRQANAFLEHPDARVICAFFVGWLSMGSLCLVLGSVYVRELCSRGLHGLRMLARNSRRHHSNDPEAHFHEATVHEKDTRWEGEETSNIRRKHDQHAFVFTLNVCLLSAGLTHFAELLSSRDKAVWDTGCAFVVAWGGMTSYVSGLVCSCILSLELRQRGAQRLEVLAVWIGILATLALVFAVNAVSIGTTRFIEPLAAYVCSRGRNLPLSLATFLVQVTVNIYVAIRLIVLQTHSSNRIRDIQYAVIASPFGRVLSVIVLNVFVLIPTFVEHNLLVRFVPFSMGGILVLVAFNYSHEPVDSSFVLPIALPPTSIHGPSPGRSIHSPRPASRAEEGMATTELLPSERRTALRVSVMTDRSFDSALMGSVEDAIVATAVRHIAMSSQSLTMMLPRSAPPRIQSFHPPSARTGRILPSQTEFAEQLEREMAEQAPALGPVVRPADRDRKLRVVVYNDESDSAESDPQDSTPQSILGSDIIYRSPVQSRSVGADRTAPSTQRSSAFGLMAVEVPEQDSYVANHDILSDYYSARRSFSIISHRTGSTGSAKRSTRHFSITSHRNRSVDELPIVPEQGVPGTATSTPSRHSMRKSRRTTFGARPISSSSRRSHTHQAALQPVPAIPPMPTLPPLSTQLFRPMLELPPISPLKIIKTLPSQARPPIPDSPPEDKMPVPSPPKSAHGEDRRFRHDLPIPPSPHSAPLRPSNSAYTEELALEARRIRPLPAAPVPDNVMGPPS